MTEQTGLEGLAAIIETIDASPQESKDTGDSEKSKPNTATKPEEHAETHSEGEAEKVESSEKDDDADSVETTDDEDGEKSAKEDEAFEIQLPDGSVEKVVLDELKKGYQRQSDYTRKQTEFAEQRKAWEAEVKQVKQQELQVLTALNQRYAQLDPVGILESQRQHAESIGDTAEVNRLDIAIMKTQQQLQAMKADQERLENEEKANKDAFIRTTLAEEHKKLAEKLPGFADPAKREQYKSTIASALKKVGYAESDIANLGDHRAATVAYYAGKYLETLDAKPKVAEALKGKAVAPTPGARKADGGRSSKIEAANHQLSKNPRSLDAFGSLLQAYGV